ncbi:MAG: LysE family translocator [Rhodospirillaceae bacterium]|nr:LysE family translocator [Rhodospirillaceae bacterium]MBT6139445.1 LysE family translocator [Rhodospirillaceae bacterium]
MDALTSLLPTGRELSVFTVAAFAMGASPGPGMLYVVARSLGEGRLAALVSVLGLSSGSFINCLVAAAGLSALLRVSPLAYDFVRYAGAAYLVYLAIQIMRAGSRVGIGEIATLATGRLWAIYRQAVVTNILNPKSGLFYLAFVPQFTDPERGSVFAQFILLGLIFNILGNSLNMAVGLFFGQIGDWLSRHPGFWSAQKWGSAIILAGLAVHLAFGMTSLEAATAG